MREWDGPLNAWNGALNASVFASSMGGFVISSSIWSNTGDRIDSLKQKIEAVALLNNPPLPSKL
jgi:hypothetical protein